MLSEEKHRLKELAILHRDNGICHSVVIFAEISMKKKLYMQYDTLFIFYIYIFCYFLVCI